MIESALVSRDKELTEAKKQFLEDCRNHTKKQKEAKELQETINTNHEK